MYSVPPSVKPVPTTEPGHGSKQLSRGVKGSIDDAETRIILLAAVLADNIEHCKLCWPLGQRSTCSLGKDL